MSLQVRVCDINFILIPLRLSEKKITSFFIILFDSDANKDHILGNNDISTYGKLKENVKFRENQITFLI